MGLMLVALWAVSRSARPIRTPTRVRPRPRDSRRLAAGPSGATEKKTGEHRYARHRVHFPEVCREAHLARYGFDFSPPLFPCRPRNAGQPIRREQEGPRTPSGRRPPWDSRPRGSHRSRAERGLAADRVSGPDLSAIGHDTVGERRVEVDASADPTATKQTEHSAGCHRESRLAGLRLPRDASPLGREHCATEYQTWVAAIGFHHPEFAARSEGSDLRAVR